MYTNIIYVKNINEYCLKLITNVVKPLPKKKKRRDKKNKR